jgi:hypothetical protein
LVRKARRAEASEKTMVTMRNILVIRKSSVLGGARETELTRVDRTGV